MADLMDAVNFTLRKDIEGVWYAGTFSYDTNPTMYGVTLRTLQNMGAGVADLDHDGDVDVNDLKMVTPAFVAEHVASAGYWLAGGCQKLPRPVNIAHFDLCYNAGPKAAIVVLQQAMGLSGAQADGIFGPGTMAHVEAYTPAQLLSLILWQRLRFYSNLTKENVSKRPAIHHWLYRVLELRDYTTELL